MQLFKRRGRKPADTDMIRRQTIYSIQAVGRIDGRVAAVVFAQQIANTLRLDDNAWSRVMDDMHYEYLATIPDKEICHDAPVDECSCHPDPDGWNVGDPFTLTTTL